MAIARRHRSFWAAASGVHLFMSAPMRVRRPQPAESPLGSASLARPSPTSLSAWQAHCTGPARWLCDGAGAREPGLWLWLWLDSVGESAASQQQQKSVAVAVGADSSCCARPRAWRAQRDSLAGRHLVAIVWRERLTFDE